MSELTETSFPYAAMVEVFYDNGELSERGVLCRVGPDGRVAGRLAQWLGSAPKQMDFPSLQDRADFVSFAKRYLRGRDSFEGRPYTGEMIASMTDEEVIQQAFVHLPQMELKELKEPKEPK